MARSRNIKPGFFTNGDLLECQPLARLLFAGLWCEADRRGILEDRPKSLKVRLLPGDNCDVDALLDELRERGFIRRYEALGFRCIKIVTFDRHQNPHQNEQENDLPAPESDDDLMAGRVDDSGTTPVQVPEQHQSNREDSLNVDSLNPCTTPTGVARAPARESRIPDGFQPDEAMIEWAEVKRFTLAEIEHHTERFVAYWSGESGPKSRKRSWEQAWRTWMLRETPGRWPGSPTTNGYAAAHNRGGRMEVVL